MATYEENPPPAVLDDSLEGLEGQDYVTKRATTGTTTTAATELPSKKVALGKQGSMLSGGSAWTTGTHRVKEALAQVTVWKRSFMCVLVLLIVQQAMMFGTVWWAMETVKEVHVSNSKLTDNDGKAVSTVNQYLIVDGVKSGDGTAFKIPRCQFDSTHAGFFDGKTEWVVPTPEGSSRHVSVEGAALRRAWGVQIDHTEGDAQWTATCPDDVFQDCSTAEDCSIEWSYAGQQSGRLLSTSLDRSLRTKFCQDKCGDWYWCGRRLSSSSPGSRHTRRLAEDRRLLTWPGSWVTGNWTKCIAGCNSKERAIDCKDFRTGELRPESDCGSIMPVDAEACSCEIEGCVTTQPAGGCKPVPGAEEAAPAMPTSDHDINFAYVGCFELMPDDNAGGDGSFMDLTCLDYSGENRCRSGLPFFNNETATTAESCSLFCLGKGMDTFALVSGANCRCGASKINTAFWRELLEDEDDAKKRERLDSLTFDENECCVFNDDATCPLEVYRYTGFFIQGGIPLSLLKPLVATTAYIDSIVTGTILGPGEEEDKPEV